MVACWEGWTEGGGLLHGNTRIPVLLHRSLALLLLVVISDDGSCFFPLSFFILFVAWRPDLFMQLRSMHLWS
jgi:hypothetical protein